jgi:hypothetical protein
MINTNSDRIIYEAIFLKVSLECNNNKTEARRMTQNSIGFPDKNSLADRISVSRSVEKKVLPALIEKVVGTIVPKYTKAKIFHITGGINVINNFAAYFWIGSVKNKNTKKKEINK